MAFAAGQAKAGLRPIVDIYSTFLQRSYDQIFQEVALQDLPVMFTMDRAGLTGPDGPTHHGVFDIGYMRVLSQSDCHGARRCSSTCRHDDRFGLQQSIAYRHPLSEDDRCHH